MFGATLITSIIPGVTLGHIGDHLLLHEFFNAYNTILVPAGAAGSVIADALADAHAEGYGTVKLEGDSYTIGGAVSTVALDIYLPTINLDLNGATIFYTGDGVCLRKRMDPFTITNAGYVANGTIDGSGAGPGAIGIQTGAVIRAGWIGVTVENFEASGSINWDQYNEDANTWMERCYFHGCDSRNGFIEWGWRAHATSPSFLYNDYNDCRFDTVAADQTAFKSTAPAQVFDANLFGFRGNINGGGTVFDLAGTSILRPNMAFSVEQTIGLDAVLFAPGSGQILYPRGSFAIINFPDFDEARQPVDFEDRGEDVTLESVAVSTIEAPVHGFGLSISAGSLGTWAAVYDGGVGADFALLKIPFGGGLADARVAAQLDSITKAEIGFRPGDFTSGSRPLATLVDRGTMIYINDVDGGIPVWSDGTDWRNAAGDIA